MWGSEQREHRSFVFAVYCLIDSVKKNHCELEYKVQVAS